VAITAAETPAVVSTAEEAVITAGAITKAANTAVAITAAETPVVVTTAD
jgi:hypothetical protein